MKAGHPNVDTRSFCFTNEKEKCKDPVKEIDEFDEFLRETRDALDEDDDIAVYMAHPNVQFSRDYDIMNRVQPQCLFVPHPNMSAARMRKFQSCLGCKFNSLKKTGNHHKFDLLIIFNESLNCSCMRL